MSKQTPPRDTLRARATALGLAARTAVLEVYRPDTCILTTKLLLELLREHDIPALPLAAGAILLNAPMARLVQERGWPGHASVTQGWQRAFGAYSIGIGYHAEAGLATGPTRYDHHVLCYVPGLGLLDASLDQASRPEHGIVAGVTLTEVGPLALAGHERAVAPLTAGLVLYETRPAERAFLVAPGWQGGRRYERVRERARILHRLGGL